MTKEELKNKISMALKDPILQQGFEIICKNLAGLEKENAELKADNDARKFAMAMSEKVEKQLREQIKKMKRHCNCKHRDSEGYCEVKRTYLIDLSYDGCDKWELED